MMGDRIAGAPISWGVCEVPGWGVQLPVDGVLAGMHELGLLATELGPDGWLGESAGDVAARLQRHGLQLVAGFVTVHLHDAATQAAALDDVARQAKRLASCGAGVLVLAVTVGDDYESRPQLNDGEWSLLLHGLDACAAIAREHGLEAALHPHVGTLVERNADLQRVLAGSSIGLCVDSGHMWLGRIDAVSVVREHASRVRHVHLKDVDEKLGSAVQLGECSYGSAVAGGLYCDLGDGAARVAKLIECLHEIDYDGWLVLERDVRLGDGEPAPTGSVARSASWLATALHGATEAR